MYKGDSRYEKRIDWNQSSEMPDRRCGRHWTELSQRKMPWKGLWQKKLYIRGFLDYERLVCEKDNHI